MRMTQDNGIKSRLFAVVEIDVLCKVLPVKTLQLWQQVEFKQVTHTVQVTWLHELAKILISLAHLHAKVQEDASTFVFDEKLVTAYLVNSAVEGDLRRQAL
ncbi:MAG TPA: hypothetical protein VGA94_01790 [Thermodesulfobacteriota bacterium]